MAKIAQRQVLAYITPTKDNNTTFTIAGKTETPPAFTVGGQVNFQFAQVSGGEITASVEKIYEGGKSKPTVLCAPSEIGDITLTAHYDDDLTTNGIGAALRKARQFVGVGFYDITIQTYNCGLTSASNDRQYPRALLVGLTEPDGDSSSGAPSTFALTFSVSDVNPPSNQTATTSTTES
jgi:hypothetical protein